MSWQLLIILSVVLYSVNGLLHRTIMKDDDSDAYAQAIVFIGIGGLFFLVVLLFREGFQVPVSWNQLLLMTSAFILSSIGMVSPLKGLNSLAPPNIPF